MAREQFSAAVFSGGGEGGKHEQGGNSYQQQRAQRAAFLAGEQEPEKKRDEGRKDGKGSAEKEKAKPKRARPADPNQPGIAAFFGGGAGKAVLETVKNDPVPGTCDEWDKTWGQGTEGLEIKRKRKHEHQHEHLDLSAGNNTEGEIAVQDLEAGARLEQEDGRVHVGTESKSRGKCGKCNKEVTTDDLRFKDSDARYCHVECPALFEK